ncbi:hypothetical protein [Baekduia sp.]|uniref:hypothetical protein n=1 Tax=Baekduia sp. TaxID=2600305 RepID=UPI002D78604C|nr:hypothetical protein [Baekduia sp.]
MTLIVAARSRDAGFSSRSREVSIAMTLMATCGSGAGSRQGGSTLRTNSSVVLKVMLVVVWWNATARDAG